MAKRRKVTTWKELKAIAERNAKRLEAVPDEFIEKDVRPYQEEMAIKVELLLQEMETDNGHIRKNAKNLSIINKIDNELNLLAMSAGVAVVNALLKRIGEVLRMNFSYYGSMVTQNDDFRSVRESIEKEVNSRFGIKNDGALKVGGFVYGLLNDQTVKNSLKETLYTSVYANGTVKGAIYEAKAFLNGKRGVKGAVESFYSKNTSEVFNHADRMASRAFGNKYGLKWFIYAGTIVKNSRAFCRAKIGGVYNTEQAQDWIYEHPSPLGVSVDMYSPTIHMGGINCRHSPMFITDQMKAQYEEGLNK